MTYLASTDHRSSFLLGSWHDERKLLRSRLIQVWEPELQIHTCDEQGLRKPCAVVVILESEPMNDLSLYVFQFCDPQVGESETTKWTEVPFWSRSSLMKSWGKFSGNLEKVTVRFAYFSSSNKAGYFDFSCWVFPENVHNCVKLDVTAIFLGLPKRKPRDKSGLNFSSFCRLLVNILVSANILVWTSMEEKRCWC